MDGDERVRCWDTTNQLYIEYHDKEWGVPVHDDKTLFEFLILEGFQAGLSWELILRRRGSLREAFDGFDPEKVAQYTEEDVERLLDDPGMIRNRRKIEATINNARRLLKVRGEFGSFDRYIWGFVGGKPIKNRLRSFEGMPSKTERSEAMARDLKRRGFKFVGPTICYSFMQAVGMVNDHLVHCFRYNEVSHA
jgi:DNA-3-methyladenine glycosylase I